MRLHLITEPIRGIVTDGKEVYIIGVSGWHYSIRPEGLRARLREAWLALRRGVFVGREPRMKELCLVNKHGPNDLPYLKGTVLRAVRRYDRGRWQCLLEKTQPAPVYAIVPTRFLDPTGLFAEGRVGEEVETDAEDTGECSQEDSSQGGGGQPLCRGDSEPPEGQGAQEGHGEAHQEGSEAEQDDLDPTGPDPEEPPQRG